MDDYAKTKLKALLIQQEDLKLFPYTDTTGNITIGVGRNLSARGVSQPEALGMLDDDILWFTSKIVESLPWASQLSDNRFCGVISIAFNIGLHGLLECNTLLNYLEAGHWQSAHDDCLGLLAAKQAPARYTQIANIFLTDQI